MDNNNFNSEEERLRAMLIEDMQSPEEAEAMLNTVQRIRRWNAPQTMTTASLIQRLTANLPQKKSRLTRLMEWWPLLLLRSQLHAVRDEIWAASALVMALGVIVTITALESLSPGGMMTFTILAPIVAAGGIAYLYDTDVILILELEDATRASARMLLLARLTLVFGFDLVLALLGSAVLAVAKPDVSLAPLIMSWLAPMAFLSGLAFLLSILLSDSLTAALFSLALWVAHIFLRPMSAEGGFWPLLSVSIFSATEWYPLLFAAGALLVAVALWLVGKIDRKVEDNYS